MPSDQPDAWNLLNAKLSVPSELRTAQWSRLPQWLRERSFYMAGVAQAELLDAFRSEVSLIAQGAASIPEAEKRLSQYLAASGYQPAPGQENTIKDLSFWRRMRVSLRTNSELLNGWGQQQRGLQRGALMAFPAWELVRINPRTTPRDWETRWTLSGGKIYAGRLIAMKDSPLWLELGSFEDGLGVNYPPFAWGSGMGWKAVPFSLAKQLGVIPAGWAPPPPSPLSSPNASLQSTPQISDRSLREELARRMRGLAEWKGESLVFTDPNGTRPSDPASLVATWAKGMPDTFHDLPGQGLMQRHALKLWSEDHDSFTREIDTKTGADAKPAPGRLDLFDDLWRLFGRLLPMPGDTPVWRGMSWSQRQGDQPWQGFRSFLADLEKSGVYVPNPNKPADSWSVAQSGARKYAKANRYQVTMVCESHHSAKDISPLVRSLRGELSNPDPAHPLVTDGETVFANGARFRVVKIDIQQDTPDGGRAIIHVQQL